MGGIRGVMKCLMSANMLLYNKGGSMSYIVAIQGKKWVQYKLYRFFNDINAKKTAKKKYGDKLIAIYPVERKL